MRRIIEIVVLCKLLFLLGGCVSSYPVSEKAVAYRPDLTGRSFTQVKVNEGETTALREHGGDAAGGRDRPASILKRGDRVTIYLFGTDPATKIEDVVDEKGMVNFPLIGVTKIEGLSTHYAEQLVEKKYIDDGYYNQMTVTIMKPYEGEYYVRGEVNNRQGKFFLTSEMTLLEAIATAGGFTVFANQRSIKLIRDGDSSYYDMKDMESGRIKPPMIRTSDIIVVKKKWF